MIIPTAVGKTAAKNGLSAKKRLWPVLLANFAVGIVAAVSLAAQEQAPSSLEADKLFDEVARVERLFLAAENALQTEQEALVKGAALVAELESRLASVSVPAEPLPRLPEDSIPSLDEARALEEHCDAQVTAFRDLEAAGTALQEATRAHGKRLQAAIELSSSLERSRASLEPLALELELRVQADKLPAASLRAASLRAELRSENLARKARESASVRKDLDAALNTSKDALKDLARQLDEVGQRRTQWEELRIEAAGAVADAARNVAFETEIAGKDTSSILALFSASSAECSTLQGELEKARTAFLEARAALAKARETRDARTPPSPENITVESTAARVRTTEAAYRLSQALVGYHAWRVEAIREQKLAQEAFLERAASTTSAAANLGDALLRQHVLVMQLSRLVSEGKLSPDALPGEARVEGILKVRMLVSATRKESTAVTRETEAKLGELARLGEEAVVLENRERENLKIMRSNHDAASEIAAFLVEIESLPTQEVVQRFVESLVDRQRAEDSVGLEGKAARAAEAAVYAVTNRLEALEDPLFRAAQLQNPGKRAELLEKLSARAGIIVTAPAPTSSPADGIQGYGVAAGQAAAQLPGPGNAAVPASAIERLEAQENALASRARVFEERITEREVLLAAIATALSTMESLVNAHVNAIQSANKSYGIALELQTRSGSGKLDGETLPPNVAEMLDRGSILLREEEMAAARRQLETYAESARRERLEGAAETRRRDSVSRALHVVSSKLDAFRRKEDLKSQSERDAKSLTEVEVKRQEQEVLRRMEQEEGLLDFVLGLFESKRAEEIVPLLLGYYRELRDKEQKLSGLEMRKLETEKLIRLAEEERKVIKETLPFLKEELLRLHAEDAQERIRFGLNLPTNPQMLSALHATGQEAPPRVEVTRENLASVADKLFDTRLRVLATELWIEQSEGRLSRLGIDAEIALLREDIGALEARAAGIQREIRRIVGHGRERPPAEESVGIATEALEEQRFAAGEVGLLRKERREILARAAGLALLNLIAIPLAAVLALRAAKTVGKRIVRHVRESGEEGALEREQRARTLVTVFNASLTTVVTVVAGIYLLKQFRIDVTPIIASAGVAGLALAFGAQSLIRDFFAGFFMLLENQYKIGDVIKIGETGGVVEGITLRLTVLRDLHGVVHFIPNGTVQKVSNMTQGWSRAVLEIGIAYKEDVDRVMDVLREVGRDLHQDTSFGPRLIEAPEVPGVEAFADSSITVRMLLKTRPGEQWNIAREARRRIKSAFDAAGIEIPFPQRVVYHMYPQGEPPITTIENEKIGART